MTTQLIPGEALLLHMQNATQAQKGMKSSKRGAKKPRAGRAQQDHTGCRYLAAWLQAGERGDVDYGYGAEV